VSNIIQKFDLKYHRNTKYRCLKTTVTNQSYIYEEIKKRLNVKKASHNLIQHFLPFRLLSKKCEDGCETLFVILSKEDRLEIFQNWALRRIF
jgi:hypothetical protein